MLISKTNTVGVGDIATFKLISGEEIVGRITGTEGGWTITKPIHIVAMMQPNGQAALQFAPFLYSVAEDSSFHFTATKLALDPIKVRAEIENNYIQATSSIAVPPKSGLIKP